MVVGYNRMLTSHDSVEATAMLGLKSLVSVTSNRQLSQYSQASLTTTYTRQDGLGLQLSTSRQLSQSMTGVFSWQIGPPNATGMSLSVVRRGGSWSIQAKIEVGVVTSLSGRLTYTYSDALSFRALTRVGTTGIDTELGAIRKWNAQSAAYVGTVYGIQGVVLKLRYSRAGQVFEFPVMLSPSSTDYPALAFASLAPPLVYFALSRLVARPVAAWMQRRREWKVRAAQLHQLLPLACMTLQLWDSGPGEALGWKRHHACPRLSCPRSRTSTLTVSPRARVTQITTQHFLPVCHVAAPSQQLHCHEGSKC